jgi:hypothetical protein
MEYNIEDYTPTMDYPIKNDFTHYFVYSHGNVILYKATQNELMENTKTTSLADALYVCKNKKFVVEKVFSELAYEEAKKQYRIETNKLDMKFKEDLGKEHDIDFINDPIGKIVYHMAYEAGHALGINQIAFEVDEILDYTTNIILQIKNSEYGKKLLQKAMN